MPGKLPNLSKLDPAELRAVYQDAKRRLAPHLKQRIASLEAEIGRLQKLMADTTLYARDRTAFDKITAAATAAQTELAAAEERWLELELLRGEIEGA